MSLYVGGAKFFGAGSYVEFYGKALDTLYTDTNVYRLAYDKKSTQAKVDATAWSRMPGPLRSRNFRSEPGS